MFDINICSYFAYMYYMDYQRILSSYHIALKGIFTEYSCRTNPSQLF